MSWQASLEKSTDSWNKEYIISSPDIDGLICAAILSRAFGARLIGLYTTTHLVLFDRFSREAALSAVWVDQDINHSSIVCIGQHLIMHDENDCLPTRNPHSFNPNNFFKQAFQKSFGGTTSKKQDKYPFGTCHMLMHLLDDNFDNLNNKEKAVLAHADGTHANMQRYRANCQIWIEKMFPDNTFLRSVLDDYMGMHDVLELHGEFVRNLKDAGISTRSSETAKRYLPKELQNLTGHQTIPFQINWSKEKFLFKLREITSILSENTRFDIRCPKNITDMITGKVVKEYPNRIERGTFDRCLVEGHIFSHAFVSQSELRCTTMDERTLLYE